MAAARVPGPAGISGQPLALDDGTLVRALSPLPGPVGAMATPAPGGRPGQAKRPAAPSSLPLQAAVAAPPAGRRQPGPAGMPVLRQGAQGPAVERLQRALNLRLVPSPQLRIDGDFGALTRQAVLACQRGLALDADGVAGRDTWFHLLSGTRVAAPAGAPPPRVPGPVPQPARAAAPVAPPPPAAPVAPPPPAAAVWEWPMDRKFAEALRRTAPKLPGSMRHEFEALLTKENLAIMAAGLVVWAGSHAFGVGAVVDIVLLVGGVVLLGMAVFDVAGDVGDFLVGASTADSEQDLDAAATHLARAIAVIGVAAFVALLFKGAKAAKGGKGGKGGKGSTGGKAGTAEAAPPAPRAPAPAPAPRRAPPPPPPMAEAPPPKAPAAPKSAVEQQLDELYAKAPQAKAEIDALAEQIAQATGGRVATADLKGRERAMVKALELVEKNQPVSKLRDMARNTIVVERAQYDQAVALLKQHGAKVGEFKPDTNALGYSGANGVVKTQSGMLAEIQVNTPEMIFAKHPPDDAKAVLGEQRYAEIAAKTGKEGGLGHALYEQHRELPAGDPRAAGLEAQSRAYYDHIRSTGGQ